MELNCKRVGAMSGGGMHYFAFGAGAVLCGNTNWKGAVLFVTGRVKIAKERRHVH